VENKEMLEACYNWLGYGNPNASIWIVGKEEGTLEVDLKKKTLKESIQIRSKFDSVMDFVEVWQAKFGIKLGSVTGKSMPWRFTARFILALRGDSVNDTSINKFIINELGRKGAKHFLTEYLPLPKKNVQSIYEYKSHWKNVNEYWHEVRGLRFEKLTSLMKSSSSVKLIISYDKSFSEDMVKSFNGKPIEKTWLSCNGRDTFTIYEIQVEDKKIILLETPFFGFGRINSLDIPDAVGRLKKYISI
jgi:hypothetical protein